jgi:hypothetical protein
MKQLSFVLFFAFAQAQPSSNPGFRLGYVRSLYIESLGTSDAARMVRDQIVGALLSRSTLAVENDKTKAHAVLDGTAMVTSGEMHWAVGSASSASSAAAVAMPGAAAASSSSASASRVSAGGGTVRITELGLRLSDEYGKILWAFDPSNCGEFTTHMLSRNPPPQKPAIVCATEQLVKAINKDAKKASKP